MNVSVHCYTDDTQVYFWINLSNPDVADVKRGILLMSFWYKIPPLSLSPVTTLMLALAVSNQAPAYMEN